MIKTKIVRGGLLCGSDSQVWPESLFRSTAREGEGGGGENERIVSFRGCHLKYY